MANYKGGNWSRRFRLLAAFATGQSLAQGLNLVTGLLLLRWLTVDAYAQYSVAFAFQKTFSVLVDLGLQGSIVALVGQNTGDPARIGAYVRVARLFRGRLFWIITALSAVAFPLVTASQSWSVTEKSLLWIAVVATVFFQGQLLYGAPLLIVRRLRAYYQGQVIPAAARLTVSGALFLLGSLFGWVAAWISALSMAIGAWLYRRASADVVQEPEHPTPEVRRELWAYLGPLLPGGVYYAFQDQIAIGLVSVFGKSTSIAQVAALGRLAQLFILISATNAVLVSPLLARTPSYRLSKVYFGVLAVTVFVAVALTCGAFLLPGPFLWLIGPKYHSLGHLVGWAVLAGSVTYVAGVAFTMHAARKWNTWLTSWFAIGIAIVTQVVAAIFLPVGTTEGAVRFGVATSFAVLAGVVPVAISGFRRER